MSECQEKNDIRLSLSKAGFDKFNLAPDKFLISEKSPCGYTAGRFYFMLANN
jgi:hypothetical protein